MYHGLIIPGWSAATIKLNSRRRIEKKHGGYQSSMDVLGRIVEDDDGDLHQVPA